MSTRKRGDIYKNYSVKQKWPDIKQIIPANLYRKFYSWAEMHFSLIFLDWLNINATVAKKKWITSMIKISSCTKKPQNMMLAAQNARDIWPSLFCCYSTYVKHSDYIYILIQNYNVNTCNWHVKIHYTYAIWSSVTELQESTKLSHTTHAANKYRLWCTS